MRIMMGWMEVLAKLDSIDSKLRKYGLMLPLMVFTILLTPLFIIEIWSVSKCIDKEVWEKW